MAVKFIELTQVKITGGKVSTGFKKIIALDHVFTIEAAAQNTALITLANGEKISVKETYNELKARFGMTGAKLKDTDAVVEPMPGAAA